MFKIKYIKFELAAEFLTDCVISICLRDHWL